METLSRAVEDLEWIGVEDDVAPGRVRRAAMKLAKRLGFSEHRTGQVGIAATELATNLVRHAEAGTVLLRIRYAAGEGAVELVALDRGPGFDDVAVALRDGWSTGGTLGIGLGAIARTASWFETYSLRGRGTVSVATFWDGTPPGEQPGLAGMTRPMDGESVCGDAWAERRDDEALDVLLADGLGHGELAAVAARAAVRAFADGPAGEGPAAAIRRIDAALRHTRGAAVAVVRIDPRAGTATIASVGNVAAWLDDGTERRALLSLPGIVGSDIRKVREMSAPLAENATLVLHSDGLTPRWNLNAYPGLRARDPRLVAATLLRDAGIRHDDASVVVVAPPRRTERMPNAETA